ncbi:DUF1206 domain-containing protein [Larsenimonas salina]|uniref:DUF1206 domain-containing protein n=1 Tax=Larsenimonas salina TaxID=1295565 RepID=UPI0020744DCC|nr:DUF1206 domain-containing protein [Larsenimonas salina]
MKHPTGITQRLVTLTARLGYAAKGVVYILIGGLATMAAFDLGGQRGGASEAVTQLAGQPFGSLMLIAMTVGLLCYTLWRWIQALFDADDKGHSLKGICVRIGYVISGSIYGMLGYRCIELLTSSGGGNSTASSRTATLMSHTGGQIAVAIVGVVFFCVGLRQFQRAIKQHYRKSWRTHRMPQHQLAIADTVARWGLCARGVVFGIIGGFLVIASWTANPDQAKGLGGALVTLAQQPFGPALLIVVALGLLAYGLYCFVNARYRDTQA